MAKKAAKAGDVTFIAPVIEKGGAGKTTLVCLLAHDLVRRGYKTLVIDTDKQGNAGLTLTGEKYDETGSTALYFNGPQPVPEATDTLGMFLIRTDNDERPIDDSTGTLRTFKKNAEAAALACEASYVVLDTPPAFTVKTEATLALCNFCFAPLPPTILALEGAEKLQSYIRKARDTVNPGLTFLGYLLNLVDVRKPTHQEVIEQMRQAFGSDLLKPMIGNRSAIERMPLDGLPVWKRGRTGSARIATQEVRQALDLLFKKMETSHV